MSIVKKNNGFKVLAIIVALAAVLGIAGWAYAGQGGESHPQDVPACCGGSEAGH
ncbi:MAG: hypothetical protein J6N51_01470 [Selenomonas sp.]|nr:hypothetical protein [Selenomonas sp.]